MTTNFRSGSWPCNNTLLWEVMDIAEIWRDTEHRRTGDVASDIDILKMIAVFCGVGLLVPLVLVIGLSYLPIEPQTPDVMDGIRHLPAQT